MKYKLVFFDMDGTLINGRSIFIFAEKQNFQNDLLNILNSDNKAYKKTIEIAKLMKGIHKTKFLKIFQDIPLHKDVVNVVSNIKKRNIKTAIVTDSYKFLADDLGKRLGIDFIYANDLLSINDILTGEVIINNKDLIKEPIGNEIYSICKSCILTELCKKLNISEDETIAIGDGFVDINMIDKAGLGIAFKAPQKVQKHANITINNISRILDYL